MCPVALFLKEARLFIIYYYTKSLYFHHSYFYRLLYIYSLLCRFVASSLLYVSLHQLLLLVTLVFSSFLNIQFDIMFICNR